MPEEVKEQGLTQERLNAYNNKEIAYSDFNPTELSDIDELAKTGRIASKEAVEEKETPTTEETKEPEYLELKSVKTKLFDKQVEANRNKQLLDKAVESEKFLKEQLDSFKNANITKATDDPFDDDSQKNIREELSLVKQQMQNMLEYQRDNNSRLLQDSQTHQQELETERGNLSIEKLQRSFPNLKTTISIDKLNNELSDFSKNVGGFENVNKYLDDEAFRKQKEEEGVKPLSEAFMSNLPIFNEIVDLNDKFSIQKDDAGKSYKDRNPDMGIDTFYINQLQQTGKFNEMLSNEKLKGANSVINKVANQKHTATLMKPETGMDIPETGMTSAQAFEVVKKIKPKIASGQKLNAEEEQQWLNYQDFARSKYGT